MAAQKAASCRQAGERLRCTSMPSPRARTCLLPQRRRCVLQPVLQHHHSGCHRIAVGISCYRRRRRRRRRRRFRLCLRLPLLLRLLGFFLLAVACGPQAFFLQHVQRWAPHDAGQPGVLAQRVADGLPVLLYPGSCGVGWGWGGWVGGGSQGGERR